MWVGSLFTLIDLWKGIHVILLGESKSIGQRSLVVYLSKFGVFESSGPGNVFVIDLYRLCH